MARCGCSGACGCHVTGGQGALVTGVGTAENPYEINVIPLTAPGGDPPPPYLGLPAYAANKTRIHPYEPHLSLYNGTGIRLRKLRALISRARQGDDTGKILIIGGGLGYTDLVDAETGAFAKQFRDQLAHDGVTVAGDGLAFAGLLNTDPRWTPVGVGPSTSDIYTVFGNNGVGTEFASRRPGSQVDIYYYNDSGPFHYQIDAAAPVTVTPPGPPSGTGVGKTSVAAAPTTHHVRVTATSPTPVFLIGVDVHQPGGLTVSNACHTNNGTSDWTSTGMRANFTTAVADPPDLMLIYLGHYDSAHAQAVSTFRANMNTIVNNAQAICPVILIAPYNAAALSTVDYAPYLTALYDVADTQAVALLDIYDHIGPWSTANANRQMASDSGSGSYANTAGHAHIASALHALV